MKFLLLSIITILTSIQTQAQNDSIDIKKYILISHVSKNKKTVIFENQQTNIWIVKNDKTTELSGTLTIIDSLNLKIKDTSFEITEIVKIKRSDQRLSKSFVGTGLLTAIIGTSLLYTTKNLIVFASSFYGIITGLVVTYYGLKAKHFYIKKGKWVVAINC